MSCGAKPMPADLHPAFVGTAAIDVGALEMLGIGKRLPGVVALENVDLTLAPGKVHARMGENGAGKSTLIKIMADLQPRGADMAEPHGLGGGGVPGRAG